jgi:hypothetical protein
MDPHIERLNHLADSIVDPFEPWTNANSAWLDKTSLAAGSLLFRVQQKIPKKVAPPSRNNLSPITAVPPNNKVFSASLP